MCSGEISATCFSLRQPNRDRRNKKETNKLLTAIANQNLFYLWRVAGGDPFDCILAYLYIFAIQLANPTVNTIPSAQDDAKREKPFRSQRSIAFEDSSLALPRCNAKVTPLRHPERKKSCYLFFLLDVTFSLLNKLVCSRTGLRRANGVKIDPR